MQSPDNCASCKPPFQIVTYTITNSGKKIAAIVPNRQNPTKHTQPHSRNVPTSITHTTMQHSTTRQMMTTQQALAKLQTRNIHERA